MLVAGVFVLIASEKVALADDSEAATEQRIGSGNPASGKRKVQSELCQECHGEDGISTVVSVPKLAGQYAEYISKQIRNFQTGERKHPIMNAMAEGITEESASDIAAYFAGNKTMKRDGTGESRLAKVLFSSGDMSRNILPCKNCHARRGKENLPLRRATR